MTILITGGRGKTSSRLAMILAQADIPFIHASHSSSVISGSPSQCYFDWLDQNSWENPFLKESDIHAAYLVAPPLIDTVAQMKSFIEFAKAKGVRRYVLLSASAVPIGGPAMGQVHEFLSTLGVQYAVLRPTWFMGMSLLAVADPLGVLAHSTNSTENFSEQRSRGDLRTGDTIYSATGEDKVPFVAAADVAAIAFRALTDQACNSTDLVVLGPELLSYDQVRG
jgi:festuclavine dehydrogenase